MIKSLSLPLVLSLTTCLSLSGCSSPATDTLEVQAEAFCAVYDPATWEFKTKNVEEADLYSALATKAQSAIQAPKLKAVFAGYVASEAGTDFSDFIEQGFTQVLNQPWKCEPLQAFEEAMAPPANLQAEKNNTRSVKVVITQQGLSINGTLLSELTSESISTELEAAIQKASNTRKATPDLTENTADDLVIEVLEPNKALFDRLLAVAGKLRIERISLVEH